MASPSLSATHKEALDRILAHAVASKITPALFLAVTTADGPIYMHQTGTKLIDDPTSAAINEDTVFWLCSQTKLITSIAALQLVDQGKIALDTPVESILPELKHPVVLGVDESGQPKTTPAKTKITLGHLLNHSSGLDYYGDPALRDPNGMSVPYSHRYKDDEDGVSTFFKILKGPHPGVPLKFEPGTDFAYGFSTDCAGFIVERLSGKSLEQYFLDHIFAPLGITSASFYLTPALKDRLFPLSKANASGVLEPWKGPPLIEQDPTRVRVHLGGVGGYASQKDYLTLLRHLLQIKAGSATAPILSRSSIDSMFAQTLTPAGGASLLAMIDPYLGLPAGGAQHGYGLSVMAVDVENRRRAGSGAWGGWANTSFFLDPASGIAVVFGTQLIPTGDKTHKQIFKDIETELYAGLV
ncbi:beta-lactamase [Mycena alexandri]|uniref:Beta-lactamase n=1 Tax=Mycena alexandri TaxID=1745969 RepID=A0AAD6X8I8_9AGAR|nr:beta-lactamase [Mycena alexandri]